MKKIILLASLLLGMVGLSQAGDTVYSTPVTNLVIAASSTITVPLGQNARGVSFQVVYSSASGASVTFTDGKPSTATLTVTSLSNLTTSYAYDKITVVSTNGLSGACLIFNGYPICNNGWILDTTITVATSVVQQWNNAFGPTQTTGICYSTAASGSAVIYATMTNYGSAYNSYTLVSSTPAALSVSTAKFAGGNDNAYISINGQALIANTQWAPGGTTALTAAAICNAILATTSYTSSIATCSVVSNVIYATATFVGTLTNYSLGSSTPSALTWSSTTTMSGGFNSDISSNTPSYLPGSGEYGNPSYPYSIVKSSNTIFKTHAFGTSQEVLFVTVAGTAPGGLTTGTTYYVIASTNSPNSFQLATTVANSTSSIAVPITGTTALGGGTFTLTPYPLSGTPLFKWQASDDCVTFNDTASTQVSFASPYTANSYLWDFGLISNACHRLNVAAPTHGGVKISLYGNVLQIQK